jgi:integrase
LAAIVSTLGPSPKDVRDRALLLVGFAGAFRRSELVAIDAGAIQWTAQGMAISLFRSKTDQEWRGRNVSIPRAHAAMCPVSALKRWLELAAITEGPVFRPLSKAGGIINRCLSGESIALIVKRYASVVGLNPAFYSGHSLRAGFATSAAAAGFPMWKIKVQTGHGSDGILSRYIRLAV